MNKGKLSLNYVATYTTERHAKVVAQIIELAKPDWIIEVKPSDTFDGYSVVVYNTLKSNGKVRSLLSDASEIWFQNSRSLLRENGIQP